MNKRIHILSIAGALGLHRGTPVRVRSIIEKMSKYPDIKLTVFAHDAVLPSEIDQHMLAPSFLKNIRTLYSFIKKHKVDVVIGHTITQYKYLFLLKLLTRTKIVLEMHGFIEEEALLNNQIGKWKYWRSKFIFRVFYPICDLITDCSETATQILSRYNKNVVTVFGGVDLKVFNPEIVSNHKVHKNEGQVLLGYAGNSRVWQGLDFLMTAFKEIREEDQSFGLVLLSSEDKLKTVPGVQLVDAVPHEEVPKILVDCDILTVPRIHNVVNRISFPSKLIEYMAMGKPVIASRTSDAHKVITHGVNGLLYDPGDFQGFKDNVMLLKDNKTREFLGRNAYVTIKNNYTWERQTGIIVEHIRKLLK